MCWYSAFAYSPIVLYGLAVSVTAKRIGMFSSLVPHGSRYCDSNSPSRLSTCLYAAGARRFVWSHTCLPPPQTASFRASSKLGVEKLSATLRFALMKINTAGSQVMMPGIAARALEVASRT